MHCNILKGDHLKRMHILYIYKYAYTNMCCIPRLLKPCLLDLCNRTKTEFVLEKK